MTRNPMEIGTPDPDAQRLDCRLRSRCLALAAKLNWDGLSCGACYAYAPPTKVEAKEEMEGMARLFHALHESGWQP